MINNEIKLYKHLVEVGITDFNGTIETLYWEGEKAEFAQKYKTLSAMTFPIHGGRVVAMTRVQGFDDAKINTATLDLKIISLDKIDQEQIKLFVKKYKSDFRKYPSEIRINNVIDSVLHPDKIKIEEYNKMIESEKIRDLKKERKLFFETLSIEKQNKIIEVSWAKLFEEYPEFECDKNNIKAKSRFYKYYNFIIDKVKSGEV